MAAVVAVERITEIATGVDVEDVERRERPDDWCVENQHEDPALPGTAWGAPRRLSPRFHPNHRPVPVVPER
jgi:hypothetical protein